VTEAAEEVGVRIGKTGSDSAKGMCIAASGATATAPKWRCAMIVVLAAAFKAPGSGLSAESGLAPGKQGPCCRHPRAGRQRAPAQRLAPVLALPYGIAVVT
jgi:hypothetical protein